VGRFSVDANPQYWQRVASDARLFISDDVNNQVTGQHRRPASRLVQRRNTVAAEDTAVALSLS